jgi:ATP-dependent exoDNAse (exonuclease V) beta subunit
MSACELADATARHAIREELGATLIVEAAAGTGKTTELVARIIAMLREGRARLSSIVAVTFTEKAAGEMKLRIRTALDQALSASLAEAERGRVIEAAAELEAARIGTVHGLCADLLRAYPIEAQVDPSFEVMDAGRSRRLLERVFDSWLERVLAEPPEGVHRVLRRRALETRGKSPRLELLEAVDRMVETRDFATPYRRVPLDRAAFIGSLREEIEALIRLAERAQYKRDPLATGILELQRQLARVPENDLDAFESFLSLVARENRIWKFNKGSGRMFGPDLPREEVWRERERVHARITAGLTLLGADLAACLSRELSPVVAAYQTEKARLGALDFFDLLLFARDLLQRNARVRNELQERTSHLFVDEFQDTDPVQSEILLLLSADDPAQAEPWHCRPIAGKLFVVGDPKQSIYRFRRADVTLYERVKAHLLGWGARVEHLTTSFRSLPDIQSLVNAAFAPVMQGLVERGQAAYVPLSPFRPARANQPAVVALPVPKPYGKRDVTKGAIKASLPEAVAAFVSWLVRSSGFVVRDGDQDIAVEARHVCLLFRRFRDFKDDATVPYVRALEARRIPHVLSGGRSFHVREEVLALGAALSAIEWPDDALSVYAALRGPFLSLSDDVLLGFRSRFGSLSPLQTLDFDTLSGADREVADALALLRRLHRGRNQRSIATTLNDFLEATRAHAALAIWPTGEQALGNVLRVLDLSRSFERRGTASSFRSFVDWFRDQAESAEMSEAPVIEESSDGVRIMTVHGAKGLEFPVVILCDPTAMRRPERGSRYIDPISRVWAQALCGAEPIELVEQRERVCDHDEAENVRIAYVATTRAREMLVVPVVGDGPQPGWLDVLSPALYPPPEQKRAPLRAGPSTSPLFGGDSVVLRPLDARTSELDAVAPGVHRPAVGQHHVTWWDPHVLELERPAVGGLRQAELLEPVAEGSEEPSGAELYRAMTQLREQRRTRGLTPSVRLATVTQLAHEVISVAPSTQRAAPVLRIEDTGIDRLQRPSGKRFGTLVHELLLHGHAAPDVELSIMATMLARTLGATPTEVDAAVAAVTAAFAHPVMRAAHAADAFDGCFREMPICQRLEDGSLLDGVVDLAFLTTDAPQAPLVLVDFKTDVMLGAQEAYALQLDLYAQALRAATGRAVECVLFRV